MRLIEDVEKHSVEEQELKIENLYFMMAFEKVKHSAPKGSKLTIISSRS